MESDQSLELHITHQSRLLQSICVENALTLATAESLTGGGIGYFLTANSGSSAYYVGGTIAYSAEQKIRLLGVHQDTIESWGVVSEQCVLEMALGAQKLHQSDLAIAVSGVAGPNAGEGDGIVGEVWIGVAYNDVLASCHHIFSDVDRESVRLLTIDAAIALALNIIKQP